MIRIKKSIVLPVLLAVITFVLTAIAPSYPHLVEEYYSSFIYWGIIPLLSSFSCVVPFSISDIFYVVLILWLPVNIVLLLLKKRRIKKVAVRLLQLCCYSFVAFYFLWGFNYYRERTATRFQLQISDKAGAFKRAFAKTIDDANYYRQQVADTVDLKQCDKSIDAAYNDLQAPLRIRFWQGATVTKKMTFSSLFAKGGILGIYGPFFGEVHINKNFTKWLYPITRAHEMAHRFGLAGEADANFYAWYVCSHSNNNWNRYSAHFFALRYFLSEADKFPDSKELIKRIDPRIFADIKANRKYWLQKMDAQVHKVTTKANDMYLKSNNMKRGVADYDGVLELIIAATEKGDL